MFLFQIIDAFEKEKLPYAVIGGYAMALHGLVRATVDIDFVLSLKQNDFEKAEKILLSLGLQSRLPISAKDVIMMRKEFIEKRNLLAWSFVDNKNFTRQVDILITQDLKKLDCVRISVGGRKISVVSLDQLLKLKKISARPQDLVDIENIRKKIDEKK